MVVGMALRKRCKVMLTALILLTGCLALRQWAQEGGTTEIKVYQQKEELSEFTLHFSSWGLNLIQKPVEKLVGGILEDNLKEELLDDIADDFPLAKVRSYAQTLDFDSGGSNFGFEARWYPGGRGSSFSLGFAVEKTTMRVGFPLVSVKMEVESDAKPGEIGTVDASVENIRLEIRPVSFHFLLSWDIAPHWRVHPYFTFGLGMFSIRAFEEGRFHISYQAELFIPNVKKETWQDDIDKSVRAFIDDSLKETETKLPSVLPVLQFNFGVAGRITDSISLRADAGFFNGFMLKGGVTFRI